ncbi:MAG: Crp/Fnr family transcriptional regulator [Candidatus Dormibacteraceae bacterium]
MPTELASVKFFQGLPEKELKRLSNEFGEVTHPAGRTLMVRGSEGVGFMVILAGEAEASMPDGRRRTLGPGDHIGEMSLLDNEGRSATVTVTSDLTVVAVPQWSFKAFLVEHPEISYRLLQSLSRRLREAEGWHESGPGPTEGA